MTRRALAFLGAIALAVTGLAGPAAAESGITASANVDLSEVRVDLNATVGDSAVEIKNLGSSIESLNGHELLGCTADSTFQIRDFGAQHTIDPAVGPFFLAADSNYSGATAPDATFVVAAQGVLEQQLGAIVLKDDVGDVLDAVAWGMPQDLDPACAPNLQNALIAPAPTDTQTIHKVNGSWARGNPSPESQAG